VIDEEIAMINEVLRECKRTMDRLHAHRQILHDRRLKKEPAYQEPSRAAMKRASMDLTRVLARLRKQGAY